MYIQIYYTYMSAVYNILHLFKTHVNSYSLSCYDGFMCSGLYHLWSKDETAYHFLALVTCV